MFNDLDKNLNILQEECAEVIQCVSKIKRFGMDDCSPLTPELSNRQKLKEECGHTLFMIYCLINNGVFTLEELHDEAKKKEIKLANWY